MSEMKKGPDPIDLTKLERELQNLQITLKNDEQTLNFFHEDNEGDDFAAKVRYFNLEKMIWLKKEAIMNIRKKIKLNKEFHSPRQVGLEPRMQMFNPYFV